MDINTPHSYLELDVSVVSRVQEEMDEANQNIAFHMLVGQF